MTPYREPTPPTPPPGPPKFSLFRPLRVIPRFFWWFLAGGWTEKRVTVPATRQTREYTEMLWIEVFLAAMVLFGGLSSLGMAIYHSLSPASGLTWGDLTWIGTLGSIPIRWVLQIMMYLDNDESREWWSKKFL